MSFKLGLVGLCTSHPQNWVPIIRELTQKGTFDIEVVAVWDSKETREDDFAKSFAKDFNIPHVCEKLEDMVDLVDGVVVHTTNWDKHIEQAKIFVDNNKAVYIDKPIAGNMKDMNTFLNWQASGKKVTGGSVMRYCYEIQDFFKKAADERGELHTVYSSIGVDDYNYGIHGYTLISAMLGSGLLSVKYIGSSAQKQIMLKYKNGTIGLLTVGKNDWLPFNITATTTKNVFQIGVDNSKIYLAMIEDVFQWLSGVEGAKAPISGIDLVEPELAAMAAKISWQNNGQEIFIDDLSSNEICYDGTQFAIEYRRARFAI